MTTTTLDQVQAVEFDHVFTVTDDGAIVDDDPEPEPAGWCVLRRTA